MLSDELKKRLSKLNRGELKNLPENREFRIPERKTVRIEEAIKGEIIKTDDDSFLLIEQSLSNIVDNSGEIIENFLRQVDRIKMIGVKNDKLREILRISNIHPEKIIYLDIETCGLSAVPLFLIGILFFRKNDFIFQQLFARDYSEEKGVLEYLNQLIRNYELLVTFNGKSFDYPFIIDRGILNKINFDHPLEHLDLLHESRRRWKYQLPNCKLQTLEKFICKRFRTGDIPGAEIPQAYHDFVKTGDAWQIGDILHHNILDLLTMVEIITHMLKQTL